MFAVGDRARSMMKQMEDFFAIGVVGEKRVAIQDAGSASVDHKDRVISCV